MSEACTGPQFVNTVFPDITACALNRYSRALQVDAIREYWSFCGEIEDLDVMRFPDTGRFKGIAFITYATVSSHTLFPSLFPSLVSRQGKCGLTHVLPL